MNMKKLSTSLLLCLLFSISIFAQVPAPSGWGDFTVGLVNDNSNLINVRMKQAMSEGAKLNYRYVYINSGVDPTSNSITWLFSPWADYAKNSADMGLHPGFVIYMLQEEGGATALRNNIQNADFMRKYFSSIRTVAQKSAGYKAIFVIEPDTWGYFLQDALENNKQSDPRLVPATINNLGTGYEYLSDLPNTLSGVAQATIRTIRKYAPDAYAGLLMSFWDVNANGVTGPPVADGNKGMVYWNQSDVDYSAKKNADLANQLLGTTDKGDFIGVEKNGWSAGHWLVSGNRNDYYWNDTQNAKWLSWSKTVSQNTNLPLLGWQISIGHIGLPNTLNRYEDTFMPYFFTHKQDFFNAGFIGFLVGKGLADDTDFTNKNGNSLETNGSAGDDGWFFEQLKQFDTGRPYLGTKTNHAPTASITSPTSGATFTAPASVTINATATDTDGTITKVDFYNGSAFLGSDNTSPYSFNWNNVGAGTYNLTAIATDKGGLTGTSSVVAITVKTVTNNAPSVNITSPLSGSFYKAPASIQITANASDSDGSITKVDFYNGSNLLGTSTVSPYSFTWTNVGAGTYSITAKATDNGGLTSTSSAVTISVTNVTNNAPSISITSPSSGSSFTAPATITINANATDTDGSISNVDFYNGSVFIGSDNASPYSFNWTNVAAGSYSITAKATDNGGATTTSAAIAITVTNSGGCNDPKYIAGTAYATGATVQNVNSSNVNKKYECKVGGWCSSSAAWAYAPGTGMYWTDAWTELGDCSGSTNQKPTVSIAAPANGASFTAPSSITINANASDDGSIAKVEFFNGTTSLGVDVSSPYSFIWNNVSAGSYALTVVATDNTGLTTTSSVVNITVTSVNNPPSVSITSPANNASFTAPASITINANASDDGSVSKVEFFNGTTSLGTDATAPYSFTWSNVTAGTYSITAKATDNLGLTSTSSVVNITVTSVNNPPSVSITSPANNASFTAPASITINANASDDGSVSKVEFFNGTTSLGTDATAPYSFTWSNVTAGTYSIIAKATDNLGLTSTSPVVNISVTSFNNPPSVSITSPTNNASFTAPASITINANASDDGSVSKVEFFNGTTSLGTDATAPYSFTWSNVTAGTYSIIAKATDNLGLTSTSPVVNISVTSFNNPPSVSITSPTNNASFTAPASITINANASDDGSVSKVEFFNGTTSLGTDATAPYSFTWSNVGAGTYSITAKATDNTGTVSTSTAVSITVTNSTSDGCTGIPQYKENGGYAAGSKVQNLGNLYECKPYPYSGWCNGAAWAYAPGSGAYWSDAWILSGPCATASAMVVPSMTSSVQTGANPFSDQLNVELNVAYSGNVVVELYTISNYVSSLLNKYLDTGVHSMTYNTSNLPSGVYVLKVTINGGVERKVLMKE